MVTVRNDTEWYKIYEDNGEYIILSPGEVKEMSNPHYQDMGMSMRTAELIVRTLLGEKIWVVCATTGDRILVGG